MYNFEKPDLTTKLPRMFMANGQNKMSPLTGIQLMWDRKVYSPIYDISFSGLIIPNHLKPNSVKIGQIHELYLAIENVPENIPLKLKVIRMTPETIGFALDSISTEGRLKMEQSVKDFIIKNNLRFLATDHLEVEMQAQTWVHGPFDTNIFIWKKDQKVTQVLFEYDHILFISNGERSKVRKSLSTVKVGTGYGTPMLEFLFTQDTKKLDFTAQQPKVSIGASWADRLYLLLPEDQGEISEIKEILKRSV